MNISLKHILCWLIGITAVVAVPAIAQSSGLSLLTTLNKGEWTIVYRDGSPSQKICVRSGMELIQLRHGGANCSRFVVEEGDGRVTVQYSCRGDGYGRTNVRRETGSLVQLRSQGIASGSPFQFDAEARRTGTCPLS